MAEKFEKIITLINVELDEEHKHAMRKIRNLEVKKEQQKIQGQQRLLALKERNRKLEEALPKLNAEILELQKQNTSLLSHYKANEKKQAVLKKDIEEKQKLLRQLLASHEKLVDEMKERNRREGQLMQRTEKIIFFKKQLTNLMKKTKAEISRLEFELDALAKEEKKVDGKA